MKLKWKTWKERHHSVGVINTYLPVRVWEVSSERMGLGQITIMQVAQWADCLPGKNDCNCVPTKNRVCLAFKAAEFVSLYFSAKTCPDHFCLSEEAYHDDIGTSYFKIAHLIKLVRKRRRRLTQIVFRAGTESRFLQHHALFDPNLLRLIAQYF